MAQPNRSGSRASGVHDLGGTIGFGPIPIDGSRDQVQGPFHAAWEARAFAVTQFAQGLSGFNTDAFRHGIEREDPETYRRIDYWSKWVRNAERMLVEGGVLAADAVDARLAGARSVGQPERTTDAVPPQQRSSQAAPALPPRFEVGDRVRVRPKRTDGGHTRLPGYVEGKVGTVVLANGGWIYPDTHAHGRGLDPQWVYVVEFAATDLWPTVESGTDESHAGGRPHTVRIDLFEPYLETA